MLAEIGKYLQAGVPEVQQVERAFKLPGDYWQRLKNIWRMHNFTNVDEEIDFFRNIKPGFTKYIEYFTLVYSAQLLKPSEDEVAIFCFWEKEETKLRRLQRRIRRLPTIIKAAIPTRTSSTL